jgi:predicted Zn-dependent protease
MPSRDSARDRLAAAKRFAEGSATLQQLRGYSDEALHAVARQAVVLFLQGKLADARSIMQGLAAVNPEDAYFARILGVAECAAGELEEALAAFDAAVRLDPQEPAGYVGRAEVLLAMGRRARAVEDLKRALAGGSDSRMAAKARAMLEVLRRS